MKLKKNDKVLVISGKDRGKVGVIMRVIEKRNKVVVEKVNMRTKHIKKTQAGPGQKIQFEGPIDASNVMVLDPTTNKPSRIGYKKVAGAKKERISKVSGASLEVAHATVAAEPEKKTKKKAATAKKSKTSKDQQIIKV